MNRLKQYSFQKQKTGSRNQIFIKNIAVLASLISFMSFSGFHKAMADSKKEVVL